METERKDIRTHLLDGMCMTQSFVPFKELQKLLSPEEYQKLLMDVTNKVKGSYANLDISGVLQNEIDEEIAQEVNNTVFRISKDEKDEYVIEEFASPKNRLTIPINPNQLDATKLADVVTNAMSDHLNYGKFDDNEYLNANQFPQMLKEYINDAQGYLARNNNQITQEATRPNNSTEETPKVGRVAEENEIALLSKKKNRLKETIENIEKVIAAVKKRINKLFGKENGGKQTPKEL